MEDINLFGANPLRVMALTLATQNLPAHDNIRDLLASAEEILAFLTGDTEGSRLLFTDSESGGTATADLYDTWSEGLGHWLVVDGKAYYQGPDGEYSTSFFSPGVLTSLVGSSGVRYLGQFEIDPADLVGVEGTP